MMACLRALLVATCIAAATAGAPGSQLWAFTFPYGSNTVVAPLIVGNAIIAIDVNNTIYSFNQQTGQQNWAKTTTSLPPGTFAPESLIWAKTTFGVVCNDAFYVFDLKKGTFLWASQTVTNSAITPIGNKYILPSNTDTAVLMERSGLLVTRLPVTGASIALLNNEVIALIDNFANLNAYSAMNFTLLWKTAGISSNCALYTMGNIIFVFNDEGNVFNAYDGSTGNSLWSTTVSQAPLAFGNGAIVFAQSTVMGVMSLDANTGLTQWTSGLINASVDAVSYGIIASGAVAVSTQTGDSHVGFAILNQNNGDLVSYQLIPTSPSAQITPMYIVNGQLVVANVEGVIAVSLASGAVTFETQLVGLATQSVWGTLVVGITESEIAVIQA